MEVNYLFTSMIMVAWLDMGVEVLVSENQLKLQRTNGLGESEKDEA